MCSTRLVYSAAMPRAPGLEALVRDDLFDLTGLTEKAMFGGMAWLLHGKLLVLPAVEASWRDRAKGRTPGRWNILESRLW